MRDMADIEEKSRYTALTVILMLGATVLALGIGFIGFGLWMANVMSFAGDLGTEPTNYVAWGTFLFLSAGPFVAGFSLLLGWLSYIFFRAPRTGVKLVFYPPITWGVAVLAFIAFVSTVCQGEFTCGL